MEEFNFSLVEVLQLGRKDSSQHSPMFFLLSSQESTVNSVVLVVKFLMLVLYNVDVQNFNRCVMKS